MTYKDFYNICKKRNLINSKKDLIGKKIANSTGKAILRLEAFNYLIKLTSELDKATPTNIRMRYIRLDIAPIDNKCPICEDQRKWSNKNGCFQKTCGNKNKDHLDYIEKIRVLNIEKIFMDKYGSKCPLHTDKAIKAKKIKTWAKYGGNPMKDKKTQDKVKQTQFLRNNGEYAFRTPDAIKKQKLAIMNFWSQYNNNTLSYMPSIGVNKSLNIVNYKKLNLKFIKFNFIDDKNRLKVEDIKKFLNCSNFLAYKLPKKFKVNYIPRKGQSMPEQDIINFIKTIDPDTEIITNSRKIIAPKELDIYLPEYKLAIEYNGLMFHSQGVSGTSMFHTPTKDKNIHKLKTNLCQEKDIQLLHIQDNEWLTPHLQEIWKSVIRNKMHKNKNRVGARKCSLESVTNAETREFLDSNHLQGSGSIGPHRYGLYYNQELVALMTFGAARFSNTDYELIRFAVKQNWTVMGAASKLLKAFRKDYQGYIISYANRRWSDGNLYRQLGFQELHISPPNFYVFHPRDIFKLWHRASFQKHKLKDKLQDFKADQTAEWNLFNNGYRKIYDSGNYVFKLG